MLVEALLSDSPIETPPKCILRWLSRLYEMQRDSSGHSPTPPWRGWDLAYSDGLAVHSLGKKSGSRQQMSKPSDFIGVKYLQPS